MGNEKAGKWANTYRPDEPTTHPQRKESKLVQNLQNPRPQRNGNPPRGGQATVGLFGVPGSSTLHSQPSAAPTPIQPKVSALRQDDRARVVHGLTFGQRRARIQALVNRPLPPPAATSAAPVVHLRQGSFAAFVRLAEREQRPVGEVITEWLTDCARLIGRDELFEGSSHAMTPAMHRAARASDEREHRPHLDDEHAEYLHRCAGAGYVEIVLAMEG